MASRPLLSVDPEFKSLISPLNPDEKQQLEENLLRDGCIHPIAVWNGIIVDGHNRQEICDRRGIKYEVVNIALPDRLAARIWIRWNQLGRRNLNDGQRAMQVAGLLDDVAEQEKTERARKGGKAGGVGRPKQNSLRDTSARKLVEKKHNRSAASKKAGVSERKVKKAKKVRQAAPALAAKVESGEVTLDAAYKQTVKAEKAEAKAAIPSDLPSVTNRFRLICAGIESVNGEVENGSLDWIITDPPYPKEYLSLYESLAKFGARALKPKGSMLVMVGQSYLPEILAAMTPHIRYHWMLAYLTPGGQAVQLWNRNVNTFWKPVLWFSNGKYDGDWVGDVCKSAINDNDKNHHRWGQSESGMADLIERFTYPGQTICDPFLGGGTTGVVAVKMNRRFVGIDVDASAIETTKGRLAAIV